MSITPSLRAARRTPGGRGGPGGKPDLQSQLSGCTGNCTETTFPKCVGSCVVAVNATDANSTRPRPQLSACTGNCTAEIFPKCTGTCDVTVPSFNATQAAAGKKKGGGPGGPRLNATDIPSCTGDCTAQTFPMCTGTCTATLTAPPAGARPDRRPTPGLTFSSCTGNCTDTTFPVCTGSCVVTTNGTAPFVQGGRGGGRQ